MGLDPLAVHGVHDGFGSGADDQFFFELFSPSESDDCELRAEAFDVAGLFLEEAFGDKQWEV